MAGVAKQLTQDGVSEFPDTHSIADCVARQIIQLLG
jgi:hypothetical protein